MCTNSFFLLLFLCERRNTTKYDASKSIATMNKLISCVLCVSAVDDDEDDDEKVIKEACFKRFKERIKICVWGVVGWALKSYLGLSDNALDCKFGSLFFKNSKKK